MLITQQSLAPLTAFAPHWQLPFWHTVWQDTSAIRELKQLILDQEPLLIKEFQTRQHHHGGTGLGADSLTAQYRFYNLFHRYAHEPAVAALQATIAHSHRAMLAALALPPTPCVIMGWANVLRQDQQIKAHNHGAKEFSYLSGNLCLGDYATDTVYANPWDPQVTYPQPSQQGSLTLFPSALTHWVTECHHLEPRVTVAWDILPVDLCPLNPPLEGYTRVDLD